jgi:hypothetical protein
VSTTEGNDGEHTADVASIVDVTDTRSIPAAEPASAVLAQYRARTRRAFRFYAIAVTVIVVMAIVGVKVAYARGELSHVSNRTAPAPTPISAAPTSAVLHLNWKTTDHPAAGEPYSDGIVVTYAGHTVTGRDARTGAVRWYYTRSDELVCALAQQDSSTIAIYRRGRNCGEVTAFDTATGHPKAWRTLADNGELAISSAPNVVLLVSQTTVHVIDNASLLDRWQWAAPPGCTVDRSLGGTAGVLTSYHCGSQYHVSLHALLDDTKPEQWSITPPQPLVPVAASTILAAARPDGSIVQLSAKDGSIGAQVRTPATLTPAAVASALSRLPRSQTTVDGFGTNNAPVEAVELAQLMGLGNSAAALWSVPISAAPAAVSTTVLAVLDGSEVVQLSFADGSVLQRSTLVGAPLPNDGQVFTAGSGVVVAGETVAVFG